MGDNEDANSPLYPFRDTESTWYDSDKTKRTEDFGYTYRETQGLSPTSDLQTLKGLLDKMYPHPSFMTQQSKQDIPEAGIQMLPQVEELQRMASRQVPAPQTGLEESPLQIPDTQTLLEKSLEAKARIKDLAPDNKYLEWIVNIKGQRHALHGRYTVDIFLDKVENDDPSLWPVSPYHVGTFSPVRQEDDTVCGRCKDQQAAGLQVTSQTPLTIALIERYLAGLIPNINEDTVVDYLTTNLHWRATRYVVKLWSNF